MAITNTPRLGLTRPGADTDVFKRSDWTASLDAIEAKAAAFVQVKTSNDRPAAGVPGRYCFTTDLGVLSYDDGAKWYTVGLDQLAGQTSIAITGNLAGSLTVTYRNSVVTVSGALNVQTSAGGVGVRQLTGTLPAGVPKPRAPYDGLFNVVPSNNTVVPPGRGWVATNGDVAWWTSSATALTASGTYVFQTTYVGV